MAKWLQVNALLRSVAEEERREAMGLDDLEVESLIKPVVIDLLRVESYAPSLDKEGEEIEDEVDIILYSGLAITLKHSFVEFDKLVRNN